MLTFEISDDGQRLQVYFDAEGLAVLRSSLDAIERGQGHDHLMTPSWSGHELSETVYGEGNRIINYVTLAMKAPSA